MRPNHKRQTWTKQEVALLKKLADPEIAKQTGRTLACIKRKRQRLGIARPNELWITPDQEALLGTMSDGDLAAKLGRSVLTIKKWRRKLKIPVFAAKNRRWTKRELKMLGKFDDVEVAQRLNRDLEKVRKKRLSLKPLASTKSRKWTRAETALLPKYDDLEMAERTGRSLDAVRQKRSGLKDDIRGRGLKG